MSKDEALQLALEALKNGKRVRNAEGGTKYQPDLEDKAITAIKSALEAKDEPVAWRYDQAKYRTNDLRGRQWAFNVFSQAMPYMDEMVQNVTPLYATPPQRTWVGLTDEEIDKAWRSVDYTVPWDQHRIDIAKAIEAKIKEKNT
jgi:hypothetical protein